MDLENVVAPMEMDITCERYSLSRKIGALQESIGNAVHHVCESPLFDTLEKRSVVLILLDQWIKSDAFRNMILRRSISYEDSCRSQATVIPRVTQIFIFSFLFLITRLRHTQQPFSLQLLIASALSGICFFNLAFSHLQ